VQVVLADVWCPHAGRGESFADRGVDLDGVGSDVQEHMMLGHVLNVAGHDDRAVNDWCRRAEGLAPRRAHWEPERATYRKKRGRTV
jgi:hypothetical protein